MTRRPGHYARATRLAATIAFTITAISALTVALTGAPDTLLRANLAILIGFAALLLVTTALDRALNPRDRDEQPRAYRHHDHNHDDQ